MLKSKLGWVPSPHDLHMILRLDESVGTVIDLLTLESKVTLERVALSRVLKVVISELIKRIFRIHHHTDRSRRQMPIVFGMILLYGAYSTELLVVAIKAELYFTTLAPRSF